jgi:hypothetical protein
VGVGILLVADVTGAPIRTVAWMAVIASTVLLTVYSFLAGRGGGLGPREKPAERFRRCGAGNLDHR